MATDSGPYSGAFFDIIRAGCRASAEAVVPLVLERIPAKRVLDVGCGEGWWGHEFAQHGCEVLGIDGDYVNEPQIPFVAANIAQPLPRCGEFDLTISLEVAEHLRPRRGRSFIADLCSTAPVVLFSAAIPGQGGAGHLNEQWPAYWVDLFAEHGYACSGALRWLIWNDDRVENWYRQNLIVAAAAPARLPELFDTPLAPVWPVVHPVLYDARR